ncbi:hypothetical protein TNCV_1874161 [Trichonephila clavipes]|nr:hypothetical protein TNCV_1874161 [Trichonephila clavipes]
MPESRQNRQAVMSLFSAFSRPAPKCRIGVPPFFGTAGARPAIFYYSSESTLLNSRGGSPTRPSPTLIGGQEILHAAPQTSFVHNILIQKIEKYTPTRHMQRPRNILIN